MPKPAATPQVQAQTPASREVNYVGTWTTVDDQQRIFDIVIFPNGQATTTWTHGKDGALAERGFWRRDGERLIVVYDDGWSDIIRPDGEGFRHYGYAPEKSLDGEPTNSAAISPVSQPVAQYVGVWRLNKEPDGSYQYLSLLSNGRATSTVNGGTEGTWTVSEKGAECKWPDGWIDRIEPASQGWQKRSWVGSATDAPADFSPALRVGESRLIAFPSAP